MAPNIRALIDIGDCSIYWSRARLTHADLNTCSFVESNIGWFAIVAYAARGELGACAVFARCAIGCWASATWACLAAVSAPAFSDEAPWCTRSADRATGRVCNAPNAGRAVQMTHLARVMTHRTVLAHQRVVRMKTTAWAESAVGTTTKGCD